MTTTVSTPSHDTPNDSTPATKEKAYKVVDGKLYESGNRLMSGKEGVLALLNGKELAAGSLSANITANTDKKTALIFGYSKKGAKEQYYRFGVNKSSQRVELELVTNG